MLPKKDNPVECKTKKSKKDNKNVIKQCKEFNHHDLTSLEKGYFVGSGRYTGRSCSKCKVPFVISKTKDGRLVSTKEPAYDCKLCEIVLCYICYVDGLNNNTVRGRRRK